MSDTRLTQHSMKKAVLAALETNDLEEIERLALQGRGVLSALVRFAYDKETLVGRRAIIATGRVASVFVGNNSAFLRETIRKLLWSLTDESGGIGWSAPELLGEIVGADPKMFSDIVPMIAAVFSIEETVFRPGVLYAFRKIARSHPEMVSPYQDLILTGLSEQDPVTRIHALELVRILAGRIDPENRGRIVYTVKSMAKDRAEAWIYLDGTFVNVEVGERAQEVYRYLADKLDSWK